VNSMMICGCQKREVKEMRVKRLIAALAGFVLIAAGCQKAATPAAGKAGPVGKWVKIFNGWNLAGWDGDPNFWSVKAGAIHAESTKKNRAKSNTFLIWRGGTVRDFQLRIKFRIKSGNAGVQFRSRDMSADWTKWSVAGYQAEVCEQQPQVGFLYEEGTGRGSLARVGEFVVIDNSGNKHTIKQLAEPKELMRKGYYKQTGWNEYLITAMGQHITLELNGYKTVEVIDNDWRHRAMEGIIALQMHMGPAMMVEYKDIYLKRFSSPFDNADVLFDGKGLDGWRFKPGSWVVEKDGSLSAKGKGNIWTKKQYGDFILDLQFKTSYRGNSGVFLRTADIEDEVQTGIEMQVLDSFTGQGTYDTSRHSCGAIYDCLAPSRNVVNPPGEWNHVTITAVANWIYIIMNGVPVIDMDLNRWTTAHQNPPRRPGEPPVKNKFRTAYKDMPRQGYIGFQYHNDPVWFRNVRIIRLD